MNKALKNARKETGLTQVEVAANAGISEVSYQRFEYGTRRPSLDTALLIARVLNSTVEKLFGAATPIQKKPDGNRACLHQNNSIQK